MSNISNSFDLKSLLAGTFTKIKHENLVGDSLQVSIKSHQLEVQNYLKMLRGINVCKQKIYSL